MASSNPTDPGEFQEKMLELSSIAQDLDKYHRPKKVKAALIKYLTKVADIALDMKLAQFLDEVMVGDWDVAGNIADAFAQLVEYEDEQTGTRPGWLTEDREPLLWKVYDIAHDLDIDQSDAYEWIDLFNAINALRQESSDSEQQ